MSDAREAKIATSHYDSSTAAEHACNRRRRCHRRPPPLPSQEVQISRRIPRKGVSPLISAFKQAWPLTSSGVSLGKVHGSPAAQGIVRRNGSSGRGVFWWGGMYYCAAGAVRTTVREGVERLNRYGGLDRPH